MSPWQLWQEKLLYLSFFCPLTKYIKYTKRVKDKDVCLILANGPAASGILPSVIEKRNSIDILTVNFAPRIDSFFQLQPRMHVLVDPVFLNQQFQNEC